MTAAFETVAFVREDAACGFECGKPALDEFFRRYAGQNQRKDVGRTWVLRRPADRTDLPKVIGFYTLDVRRALRLGRPEPRPP